MNRRSRRYGFWLLVVSVALAGLAGCGGSGGGNGGGGGGGGTNVTVSITTPNTAAVSIGVNQNVSFVATVAGNCSGAGCGVTWSVDGVVGGNSTFGTIGTGTSTNYTAPVAVPSPATFNITATSVANSAVSASVAVTITAPPVAVAITTPANLTQTLSVNGTLPITASVTGGCGNSCGVTWTVNGVSNGNSTFGTISGLGLSVTYDAPAAVPSPATFNVTATSVADPTKSASVSVTIESAASGVVVSITSPASPLNVAAGSAVKFQVDITGTANTGVSWTVNGIANGNSTYGIISNPSLSSSYVAPFAVPVPATFNIVVTSLADSSKSATVSVTITTPAAACGSGSESMLKGQYAFILNGFNSTGFQAVVGSFAADGSGNIIGGEADRNASTGSEVEAAISAGLYSVASDNRGCVTLVTDFGSYTTRFQVGAVSSNVATSGHLMVADPPTSNAYIATGQIFQQDTASFSAGLNGGYTHLLVGADPTTNERIACAGVHTSSAGIISDSEQTCNQAGTVTQAGPTAGNVGSYSTIDSYGRFTETVNSTGLVAYSIYPGGAATEPAALVMTTGNNPVMAGEAYAQTGAFGQSSLASDYVLYANGVNNATSSKITFGLASGDGIGTLAVNSYYENDGGTWVPGNTVPSYTYVVDSYGGVTLSTNTVADAGHLYLTGTGIATYLSVDAGVFAGFASLQTGNGTLGDGSLNGTFFGGTTGVVSQDSSVEGDIAALNGSGSASVTYDTSSTTNLQTDQSSTPTVSVAGNGTFTTNSSGTQVVGVVINPDYFLLADNTSSPYPTILLFGPGQSPP
jgi:hypothetical protein